MLAGVMVVAGIVARVEPASELAPPTEPSDGALPDEADPVVEEDSGGVWSAVPAPPVRLAAEPAVAWTGREALLVGPGGGGLLGAAYDPARRSWRKIASPPLSDRVGAVVGWLPPPPGSAGGALVVWGGEAREGDPQAADGAAYDPVTDTWRPFPEGLSARASAASTVTGAGLLIVGGTDGGHAPLRDGAVLRIDSEGNLAWEPVPDLPAGAPRVVELVWIQQQALALTEASLESGTVRMYGWRPGALEWREHPPVPARDVRAVSAAASGATLAVWTGDGGPGRGRLALYDVWARDWSSVEAPAPGTGRPAVAWADGKVAVWGAAAGERATLPSGALYEPETDRWSRLGPARARPALPWPGPPVWVGNELLVLGVSATWRPEGRLPPLREDTDAVVYLATGDRLVTVDVDERAVSWRHVPAGATGSLSRLTLRDSRLITASDGDRVLAIPIDGGDLEELEATAFLPAGDGAVWLLRSERPWTAVKARGDGIALSEPMPLPYDRFPVAGLAQGLVVAGEGTSTMWDPVTQTTKWSIATDWPVAAGAVQVAACDQRRATEGVTTADGSLGGCPSLVLVDMATGVERTVTGEGMDFFHTAGAAFSPGDAKLAVPASRGENHAIVIIGKLDDAPRITAVAQLNGSVSGPVTWHADGRWVFAAVNQRLVAVEAVSGEVFDAGIDVPEPIGGMAVSGPPG